MKITSTRKIEMMLVNLYKCSIKKEHDEEYKFANNIMQFIIFCFEIISIFTETDHANIIKKLYFSKDNVMDVGLKRMEKIVFVQERTLLFYRKKYCEVVNAIFVLIEDFDFLNEFGTQPGSLF